MRDQGTVDFPFGRRAKPSLIRFSDSRKLVTIPFNSLSSSLRDAVYDTIRDSCESGKLAVTGAEIEACKYYFAA